MRVLLRTTINGFCRGKTVTCDELGISEDAARRHHRRRRLVILEEPTLEEPTLDPLPDEEE